MGIVKIDTRLWPKSLPNVKLYQEKFGHRPAEEAFHYLTDEALDQLAAKAVEEGQPIVEWRDRHLLPTGTHLDDLYGITDRV